MHPPLTLHSGQNVVFNLCMHLNRADNRNVQSKLQTMDFIFNHFKGLERCRFPIDFVSILSDLGQSVLSVRTSLKQALAKRNYVQFDNNCSTA